MLGVGGAWLLMSRRFKRLSDRYDSITVPDYYLESRFRDTGHWLRHDRGGLADDLRADLHGVTGLRDWQGVQRVP